ncbi:N-acetylmuramidase domain-containing protein [Actibacterium sp. MT2.3-13A]|uniref:N-acetylmuramidase domain-containing protein n=1 Tax=Actibacterium sp. MT2.3-13A TaxID=2828332 RepID=UPI001BA97A11|nr:N-acetylmuramidase domain-containing protein [Actibacterium sp. MT2.3-13A]
MSYPWFGQRGPLPPDAFAWASRQLQCDEPAIRAIWDVEASGRFYDSDGGVLRRFEPHHAPGFDGWTWRDSLKLGAARREALFLDAYAANPEAAMRATSWGGPQIMGFNHRDAGFGTARGMVRAMADSERAHVEAFVALVDKWKLGPAIRAHDWLSFARGYNGSGQPHVYARRIEAAYRVRSGGRASPTVLRLGSRGEAVKRLQRALGVPDDGAFGPVTARALRAFQQQAGLVVDGIAGHKTWAALEAQRDARPAPQPTNLICPMIGAALKGLSS